MCIRDRGDDVFYDIVCEGSTKTLVWQPADLGAYLHIVNGERYLGFTPTMNYNAKAAYGIKGLVKVPELKDGEPNDFLTRLFDQVKANIVAEHAALQPRQEQYNKTVLDGRKIIESIETPEAVSYTHLDVYKRQVVDLVTLLVLLLVVA